MNTFDEFVIVNEKSFTDLSTPDARTDNGNNKAKFSDVTQFAALEFQIDYYRNTLQITDIGNVLGPNLTLAQIIRWQWDEKGVQRITDTKIFKTGGFVRFSGFNKLCSIVIRILKKKDKSAKNPFQSFISADDDLTIEIGDKKETFSASLFRCFSPVIDRMLSAEMREKQQRSVTLNELGIDMEQFLDFLLHISPNVLQEIILPNPKNVFTLLKLADFFQIDWLKSRCEAHLINCVEIPLIDRVKLIEKYQLNNLKNFILRLDMRNLRAFFKENHGHLKSTISEEFYGELIERICG
ncbi:hypothetical protein niasHS_016566 [Heterodera schachtii]|uniref:BTB domain-containing protein n=1 Tax=Heterodera schachtii TaxID=97005 RepID=A0ABD2HZD4_HETSC